MVTKTEYLKALEVVKSYKKQSKYGKEKALKAAILVIQQNNPKLTKLSRLLDIEVSSRLYNEFLILDSMGYEQVVDLEKLRVRQFLRHGVGEKLLNELKALCACVDIQLSEEKSLSDELD